MTPGPTSMTKELCHLLDHPWYRDEKIEGESTAPYGRCYCGERFHFSKLQVNREGLTGQQGAPRADSQPSIGPSLPLSEDAA